MTTSALLTDKYEYTMLQSAIKDGSAFKPAVFEAFTRRIPKNREYGTVAGLERIIQAVENFTFDEDTLSFLSAEGINNETIEYLRDFRFSGQINAYPEGEVFFANSPVVQVIAPFGEAVLLETVILSILNYDCSVASAASQMVNVNPGYTLVELGGRRTHENSAVAAARAAYIAGFAGTSNLQAAKTYGIPVFGTSAHAFTLAHKTEKEAFASQIKSLGINTTLLVDTYDTEQGIRNAIEIAGTKLGSIRIDSGDIKEETIKARKLLDELGATETKIVISGDLDEHELQRISGAPVDIAGVGTRVVTGSGHPTASMVYKLVSIQDNDGTWRNVEKKSQSKASIGGKKKVSRKSSELLETIEVDNASMGEIYALKNPTTELYNPMVTAMVNGERISFFTTEEARELHNKILTTSKRRK